MAQPKPMKPLDRKIRTAAVNLADARTAGVEERIFYWSTELDRLLDEKILSKQPTLKKTASVS